jgi:putative selenium metabolism hydrolase
MDFEAIKKAAQAYGPDMTRFLRDMIAIPSESCEEKGVAHRIAEEMKKLGYDKVEFDALGNVIGSGDKIIAIDSHIDTVGIGNRENWTHDPYEGYEDDKVIYGRGGSDQEGGMAAAAYGTKIMKDLGLIPEGYKIMVVGSVQEEDCDGMCWQSIVNEYFKGPEDASHFHRAHRRRHLSRSPRPHGDPRRHARRLLPRIRPRARRQRHPQDGRGHSERARPERERRR